MQDTYISNKSITHYMLKKNRVLENNLHLSKCAEYDFIMYTLIWHDIILTYTKIARYRNEWINMENETNAYDL